MDIRTILYVLLWVCLAVIVVCEIQLMRNNKKIKRLNEEIREGLEKIKNDLCVIESNLTYLELELNALGDACEDFYDNEYIPFVEAHEVASDK